MVKNGYYGNEDLDLEWDRIKVRQMTLFTTTLHNKLILTRYFLVHLRKD